LLQFEHLNKVCYGFKHMLATWSIHIGLILYKQMCTHCDKWVTISLTVHTAWILCFPL